VSPLERVRLDKWLWAARFFSTRSRASAAVSAGRVEVGGARAKPAREVRVGDEIRVTAGATVRTVVVRGLSERRGPAREAEGLYEETAESRQLRERLADERRLSPPPGAGAGRPSKRDRRRIARLREGPPRPRP
jgi:ribosome-associated heat shock protein Hsp15